MPDGSYSVSDIKDYIEYNIKKHKTLTSIPPIHIYINIINNRLLLKINDRHKLELKTPEKMKLFGSTKKLTDKSKVCPTQKNLGLVLDSKLTFNEHIKYILSKVNKSIELLRKFQPGPSKIITPYYL